MREQPDFSTSPRPRRPPLRDLLAIVVGLVALGFALHTAWSARRQADQSRDRLLSVRREVTALESRLRSVSARAGAGSELLARAAAASEAPPERIVAALAEVLPEDVRVDRLSIAYGEVVSLDLRLVSRDAAGWDLALARLVEAGTLEKVTPGPERRDGEIRTTVTAEWKGRTR
jgi:lambda repressor-like predicted transcriptional regulator